MASTSRGGVRRQAGHLRLVGNEVVVHVAGEEASGSRLFADDANDVVAVPVSGLAQEGLFAVVVVSGVEAEDPGAAAMGEGRVGRGHVPAGEGAGADLDVVLGSS